MFKKILVPTDGSKLSEQAISKAVAFAKETGALLYGFTVRPDFTIPVEGGDLASRNGLTQ
jgi:nucleotide-binding universal stress UspA family protein